MSENILELKKISKSFSGVEVLHEVSLAVRPGEVHALLGENGAGKSTLVKIITGVHHPDKGEILLNGEPVHFSDARELTPGWDCRDLSGTEPVPGSGCG